MENTALKNWLIRATADEIRKLADIADTSVAYLHHVATGRRNASPELAGKIEEGVLMLRLERPALPDLSRGDISKTCGECPFYKHCKEKKDES